MNMKKLIQKIRGFFSRSKVGNNEYVKTRTLGKITSDQWISYKGEIKNICPANNTDYSLNEIRAMIGGDMEIISLGRGLTMIVNANGKMRDMPMNVTATQMFRETVPHSYDFIVGDVMVVRSEHLR